MASTIHSSISRCQSNADGRLTIAYRVQSVKRDQVLARGFSIRTLEYPLDALDSLFASLAITVCLGRGYDPFANKSIAAMLLEHVCSQSKRSSSLFCDRCQCTSPPSLAVGRWRIVATPAHQLRVRSQRVYRVFCSCMREPCMSASVRSMMSSTQPGPLWASFPRGRLHLASLSTKTSPLP